MITTGLPYDFNMMEDIATNGAIVDMSLINFPTVLAEDQKRTAFIFLRNTGFDVKLDFSKCSYEDKEEFLKLYVLEDIECNNKEFSNTWIKILLSNIIEEYELENKSFLNKEELSNFIKRNIVLVDLLTTIIYSTPVFLLKKLASKDDIIFDIEEDSNETIKNNLMFILQNKECNDIFINIDKQKYQQKDFINIFTENNYKLFESINTLDIAILLFGAVTTDLEEWHLFVKELFNSSEENI